jgi:beta-galactosidase
VLALLAGTPAAFSASVRERLNFDQGWQFHCGEVAGGEAPTLRDDAWRRLDLPHDWSIEGPYSPGNASGTGYLPGGIGWYRKTFALPESLRGRKVFIEFDGVYRDSDVWINAHLVGHRPYGYASFQYDLSPYLNFGGTRNVVAVRVDHSVIADSRWYTGSGIYRHVWLTTTDPVHVAQWGTFVRTPVVTDGEALVSVEASVVNESKSAAGIRVVTVLEDPAGRQVATLSGEEQIAAGATRTFAYQGRVQRPQLWSLDHPDIYTAVTTVYAGDRQVDEYRTPFGIRSLRFDPNAGFFLNGQPMKLKGVCIHHDLGALGAAFFEAALERRLRLLKELGVNAIRCSHNPMAPELYDLCDRIGLLVMDEAFDEWTGGKHKWTQGWNVGVAGIRGYHEVFDEWSTRDLEDMVLRDRNHPSIVLWSIGNEIDYPGDPFTHPFGRDGAKPGTPSADVLPPIARRLAATVKGLDVTRPVTQALADIGASNATGLASLLDVTGYNYQEANYARDHQFYPERIILGTENSRTATAWEAVARNNWVVGQFLWTGIDYLGEADRYPSRGSQSGLLDFCGFRKPEAWFRQALWSSQPMVYAVAIQGAGAGNEPVTAEHWNWAGDGRKTVPVEVYTNCQTAELFLNGRSLGEKTVAGRNLPVLRWDVPNEPGIVRAIGKQGGTELARFELATAGAPDHIEMLPDKSALHSTGIDLAHIEVRVVDAQGRRVPGADQWIEFEVSGAGRLAAVDNADPLDISPVQAKRRRVWQGRALAIVRSGREAGTITIRATGSGVKPAEATLTVR